MYQERGGQTSFWGDPLYEDDNTQGSFFEAIERACGF